MKIILQITVCAFFTVIILTSCNKYLNTDLPAGYLVSENAFVSDNSAGSVVTGIFISTESSGGLVTGGTGQNLGYITSLYTDETKSLLTGNFADIFYKDIITSSNVNQWTNLYNKIYLINAAIEGINNSSAVLNYKDQWLGECYFLRAYFYFYLTNLYGDVPLATTSDYKINNTLSRSPQTKVYVQILSDLRQAQNLLSTDYKDANGATTTARIRPNKYAAMGMAAKAYLYAEKWDSAEIMADSVINNTNYQLDNLSNIFTPQSKETLWGMALISTASISSYEYGYYNNGIPASLVPPDVPSKYVLSTLSDNVMRSFDTGDLRLTNWVRTTVIEASGSTPAVYYYFPNKYTNATPSSVNEILLRLAEIYLIRAEARAHENNIEGCIYDVNVIRARAGLPNTTATTQASLLAEIAKQRQAELFTENGNRFFDLKRTGGIDSVMSVVAPTKPTTWESYMQLWPIPPADIIQDPAIIQNPGYGDN
ncbi:MAG: RagB/SusD family nutrient uptake outer membrane protein [Arachidicoccus sp.]|nr:RagB/SusD family nutrient uptake outer membrane protein [Arachidicoccus sp.]